MATRLACWETEPVASLPYTLITTSSAASRLFLPDPHDPAEISAVGSEIQTSCAPNNAREPKRTLAGQHEREFSVEQTNERGAYSTFTSTALAFGFSAFGRCTKRTPSLNSARSFSSATFSGKLKDRTKLP